MCSVSNYWEIIHIFEFYIWRIAILFFFFCFCSMFVLIYHKYLLIYIYIYWFVLLKKKKSRWSMRITYDHDIELSRWNKIFGKGNLFEIHFFFFFSVRHKFAIENYSPINVWSDHFYQASYTTFKNLCLKTFLQNLRYNFNKKWIFRKMMKISDS